MARTRIKDLPKDINISTNEMGRIYGGGGDLGDPQLVPIGIPMQADYAAATADNGSDVDTVGKYLHSIDVSLPPIQCLGLTLPYGAGGRL